MQTHKFIGIVKDNGCVGEDLYEVVIRNRLKVGEEVEVMTPDDQFILRIEEMFDFEGKKLEVFHGGAGTCLLKLKKNLPEGTIIRIKVS